MDATATQERPQAEAPAECHNRELGRRGEEAAARYLERKGFEILERNWECAAGEADIIAFDEDVLVFVEVKTRSNADKGLPEEAVDKKKRERYERIAAAFLATFDTVDIAVRFDVVSILVIGGERALLRHHHNAFSADE
ncbi:YraN family protein [Raoultibacter phocaeensis]|uniref:YraN family protein n=1 Tax=Raoultibacter phocaeensis TaxID=2479841 RepID=UPI0021083D30|nr:YraN family protein [Raoultibacter phocaeensis]